MPVMERFVRSGGRGGERKVCGFERNSEMRDLRIDSSDGTEQYQPGGALKAILSGDCGSAAASVE